MWADWDEELLKIELLDLQASDFDLSLTGFDTKELDDFLLNDTPDEDAAGSEPVYQDAEQVAELAEVMADPVPEKSDFFHIAPADLRAVVADQLDYLLCHGQGDCGAGCIDCARLAEVAPALLRPFGEEVGTTSQVPVLAPLLRLRRK